MSGLYTVIIKNNSGSDRVIEDLGITIVNGSSYNMDSQHDYDEIFTSASLRTLVGAGTLVVNNGVTDLSVADGLQWLKPLNEYGARDLFYTKTQLQTPGSSYVHWDNITNTPSYGSVDWKDPVLYRVLNTEGTTTGAIAGDIIVDGTDYKQYDGTTWNIIGTVTTGDRVIDLSQADNDIVDYDGTDWTLTETPLENNAVMVGDDGDGKQAQYVYNGTDWVKIGDVDFAGHFDGGAGKHDASEIDVEGTYTNISGTPTNLESTISAINTKLGTIESAAADRNTLDEAYDEGGAGVGRTINVDSGAVVLTATGGYAPLQLTNLTVAPNAGLLNGQLAVINGMLYSYDQSRLKWLSVHRETIAFGRQGVLQNGWLNFWAGELPSNNSGIRMGRNGVITMITAQADKPLVNGNADINVRRNDATPNIATLTVVSGTEGNSQDTYNVNVAKDEYLQCRIDKPTTGGVEDLVVTIEIAYTV